MFNLKSQITIYAFMCALFFAYSAHSEQLLKYEPEVTEISGNLSKGKFQHPNGTWVEFYVLKLVNPASIVADGVNGINESESNVEEIQIYSSSQAIRKVLSELLGKNVTVKGTIFHAHTAWHVRPLVMDVIEVR